MGPHFAFNMCMPNKKGIRIMTSLVKISQIRVYRLAWLAARRGCCIRKFIFGQLLKNKGMVMLLKSVLMIMLCASHLLASSSSSYTVKGCSAELKGLLQNQAVASTMESLTIRLCTLEEMGDSLHAHKCYPDFSCLDMRKIGAQCESLTEIRVEGSFYSLWRNKGQGCKIIAALLESLPVVEKISLQGAYICSARVSPIEYMSRLPETLEELSLYLLPSTRFPENLSTLPALKRLSLFDVWLRGLPAALPFSLIDLTLHCAGLHGRTLLCLTTAVNLCALDIKMLDLKGIGSGIFLPARLPDSLQQVVLSGCSLREFPEGIKWLPRLRYLDISNNLIPSAALKNVSFATTAGLHCRVVAAEPGLHVSSI